MQRLSAAKDKADARGHFKRFIAKCVRDDKWSPEDVAEYTKSIGILMGNDDVAAMNLFNAGVYENAEAARLSAQGVWKEFANAR